MTDCTRQTPATHGHRRAIDFLSALSIVLMLLVAACSDRAAEPAPREPAGPRLFVTNEIGGDVTVIDAATATVIHTIPVGKRPRGIRASHDGSTLFVALSGSPMAPPGVDESTLPPPERRFDGVGVIDARTRTLARILPGGSDPEQFALSADGSRLFIANEDAGETSVLDVANGTIVQKIKVGGEPEGVDLTPDGKFVYVTSEEDNQVFVIDAATLSVAKVIDVGPRPRATAFLTSAPRAYVTAENDSAVYVIDTAAHRVITRIALTGEGVKPMGVVASPEGQFVYVTTGRGGSVVKIDTRTNAPVATLQVGERPWGIAISRDGRTLYTANGPSNDVSFVDTGTWTVSARVRVGERPWGLVVVP
jgi:YVTN family beta-propeller protein